MLCRSNFDPHLDTIIIKHRRGSLPSHGIPPRLPRERQAPRGTSESNRADAAHEAMRRGRLQQVVHPRERPEPVQGAPARVRHDRRGLSIHLNGKRGGGAPRGSDCTERRQRRRR